MRTLTKLGGLGMLTALLLTGAGCVASTSVSPTSSTTTTNSAPPTGGNLNLNPVPTGAPVTGYQNNIANPTQP